VVSRRQLVKYGLSWLSASTTSTVWSEARPGPHIQAADGVVSAVYNDEISQLTFLSSGSNLHYWHVKHCHQLINDGDPAVLTASYMVRPVQDITSP
jgi:hypothetical protein